MLRLKPIMAKNKVIKLYDETKITKKRDVNKSKTGYSIKCRGC